MDDVRIETQCLLAALTITVTKGKSKEDESGKYSGRSFHFLGKLIHILGCAALNEFPSFYTPT